MSGHCDGEEPCRPRGSARGSASQPGESTEVPSSRTSVAARSAETERCPRCGARRLWDDVYCEDCGYDFAGGTTNRPLAPAATVDRWEAVVEADRELFDRNDWPGIDFPEGFVASIVALVGEEVWIGRGVAAVRSPAIDLEDPAASRLHAVLVRQHDGSYALLDKGSTNGTTLNDDPTTLLAGVPSSLKEGDRIRVGAWTTITVRRAGARNS